MINARIQLTGFLGDNPKPINKNGRSFTALRVATNDSYQVKEGEAMKWVEKETEWHDVLVFRPAAVKYANELKKSDKVDISASLSYRQFKDEKGITRKEAVIFGNFIEKIDYNKQDSLFTKQVVKELAESMAA